MFLKSWDLFIARPFPNVLTLMYQWCRQLTLVASILKDLNVWRLWNINHTTPFIVLHINPQRQQIEDTLSRIPQGSRISFVSFDFSVIFGHAGFSHLSTVATCQGRVHRAWKTIGPRRLILKHDNTWEHLRPKETSECVISNDITFLFETHFCCIRILIFLDHLNCLKFPDLSLWNSRSFRNQRGPKRSGRWVQVETLIKVATRGLTAEPLGCWEVMMYRHWWTRFAAEYTWTWNSLHIHPHPSGLVTYTSTSTSFVLSFSALFFWRRMPLCWNTPRTAASRLARARRARCPAARLGWNTTKHDNTNLTDVS